MSRLKLKNFTYTSSNKILNTSKTRGYIMNSLEFIYSYSCNAVFSADTLEEVIKYCVNKKIKVYGLKPNKDLIFINKESTLDLNEFDSLYLKQGNSLRESLNLKRIREKEVL